eukprot:PITA_04767
MMPTWDNGRIDKVYIAKRIDRFIVHGDIIDKMGMPHSSIGNAFISYHRPIYLSWKENGFRKGYPFKFNRTWLEDPDFNEVITKTWKDLSAKDMTPPFMTFRDKLAAIRKVVKDWKFKKIQRDRATFQETQRELDSIFKNMDANSLSFSMRCRIKDLERHEKNTIWKISDGQGGYHVSQRDISKEAVRHFKNQYRRREGCGFQDILWGIDRVPQMFDDGKNESLFQPITEDELLGVMKAFKKDKCPAPDGWTIEFFIHFFDIIKQDLLRMVEASRISCSIHHLTSSTQIALIPKKEEAVSFQDYRPISLCNITFKIITKIIAERIKVTLATFLTKDQHAF